MDTITQYYNAAVEAYGLWGLALMACVALLFGVQMHYYLGLFRRLPSFKIGGQRDVANDRNGISVVLVMGDDYLYVENTLPLLLAQDYDLFEVIVVYVGSNGEFAEMLAMRAATEPHLAVSRIKQHPLFPISNKMAINIGVKAARYDNIVVTTPDSKPVSSRWLSLMAKGFRKGEVVIGYCGIEQRRGLTDKIVRSSRMFSSLLYLTAAIRRRPYRGTIQNMGFARSLYFDHKGFGHLNLNLGEDDLFMQQIFSDDNYTIVMHPRATMRQARWGGLRWWLHECRLRNHAYPFYPLAARNFIEWEAGSRLLFFLTVAACMVLMPDEVKIGAAAILLARFVAVSVQMARVAKRLGEKKLVPFYFINDLFEPLLAIGVVVSRMIRPIREVWR
ncbi:MAG: glycosyltransferase [Alistipes sp.]|jgi:glycosyltransferase involved in cell wall biosynthesis|nr:glycosyltransferase [Alistipes sp.]